MPKMLMKKRETHIENVIKLDCDKFGFRFEDKTQAVSELINLDHLISPSISNDVKKTGRIRRKMYLKSVNRTEKIGK